MIPRRTMLLTTLSILSPLLLAGCGSAPPPPPALKLTIQGGADQNPDPAGHPTPVAVHIYELASPAAFDRADIFALIDRQAETLGGDCLASEEVIVAPGEQRIVMHELNPGTRSIGAIALFRAIDQAKWRVDASAAPHGQTPLTLVTHDTHLTITSK